MNNSHPTVPSRRHAPGSIRFAAGLRLSATTGKDHLPFLRRKILEAHRLLRPALRELSVALVGERTMTRLHERHLGVAGPTDVLSFELEQDLQGRVTAAEVVVCVPQAARQARRRGHPLRNELLLYILHGMLHLMGYDDRTERGYRKMHEIEDQVLSRIGIGRTFRANSVASDELPVARDRIGRNSPLATRDSQLGRKGDRA